MRIWHAWYPDVSVVPIEAESIAGANRSVRPARAAAFFSGGVDSFFTAVRSARRGTARGAGADRRSDHGLGLRCTARPRRRILRGCARSARGRRAGARQAVHRRRHEPALDALENRAVVVPRAWRWPRERGARTRDGAFTPSTSRGAAATAIRTRGARISSPTRCSPRRDTAIVFDAGGVPAHRKDRAARRIARRRSRRCGCATSRSRTRTAASATSASARWSRSSSAVRSNGAPRFRHKRSICGGWREWTAPNSWTTASCRTFARLRREEAVRRRRGAGSLGGPHQTPRWLRAGVDAVRRPLGALRRRLAGRSMTTTGSAIVAFESVSKRFHRGKRQTTLSRRHPARGATALARGSTPPAGVLGVA